VAGSQGRTCKADALEDYSTMTPEQNQKKNTPMKHLEKYYVGKGCRCEARSSNECGCNDVDWTPKAVYELRAERDSLQVALGEISNLAKTLKGERDDARAAFVIATDQTVIAQGKVREANKERDEARFLLKEAQSALDIIHLEVGGWIKTMKEHTD